MVFICSQCGQCCMYLGDYIVIESKKGPYSFAASCVSTGTSFQAVVDTDKRSLFDDRTFLPLHPHACPFLRQTGEGRIVCTIHETSPAQCKLYRCVVFRIYSKTPRKSSRPLQAREMKKSFSCETPTVPRWGPQARQMKKSFSCKTNDLVGYMTGMGALHSDDPLLKQVYETGVRSQPPGVGWEEWLTSWFEQSGYRIS